MDGSSMAVGEVPAVVVVHGDVLGVDEVVVVPAEQGGVGDTGLSAVGPVPYGVVNLAA